MSSTFLFGSNLPPFAPVSEKDPINGQMYEFQSITKMPPYSAYSIEKLRYDDYLEKRKKQRKAPPSDQEIANELFQRFDVKADQNMGKGLEEVSSSKNSYLSLDIGCIYHNIMCSDDSIEKKSSDLAIVLEDSKFLCHKIILLCRSPILKLLFEKYPDCKQLSIPSVKKPVMEIIIQYIYTGTIDSDHLIIHDFMIDVFEAAIILQMKPLIEILSNIISSTTKNVYSSAKIWGWTNKMYTQKLAKNYFDNYFIIDEISANISLEESTTGLDYLISDLHTKTKNLFLESFGMEIEKSTNYLDEQGPSFLDTLLRLLEDTTSLLSKDASQKLLKWSAKFPVEINTAKKRQLISKLATSGTVLPSSWLDMIPVILGDSSTDECVEFFFECCIKE